MNKINLLTPLVVGAASLAPLMTMSNCSKTTEIEIDLSKIGEWKPSKEKIENKEGGYTDKEMTDKYFEVINNNPICLAEDWASGIIFRKNLKSHTLTGKFKVLVSNIDVKNHIFTLKCFVNSIEVDGSHTIKIDAEIEFINIKFGACWFDTEGFFLQPPWTEEEIIQATNWAFKAHSKLQFDDQEPEEQRLEYNDSSTEEQKRKAQGLIHDTEFHSYYMSDCKHSQ